jgi:hypothetical protein
MFTQCPAVFSSRSALLYWYLLHIAERASAHLPLNLGIIAFLNSGNAENRFSKMTIAHSNVFMILYGPQ